MFVRHHTGERDSPNNSVPSQSSQGHPYNRDLVVSSVLHEKWPPRLVYLSYVWRLKYDSIFPPKKFSTVFLRTKKYFDRSKICLFVTRVFWRSDNSNLLNIAFRNNWFRKTLLKSTLSPQKGPFWLVSCTVCRKYDQANFSKTYSGRILHCIRIPKTYGWPWIKSWVLVVIRAAIVQAGITAPLFLVRCWLASMHGSLSDTAVNLQHPTSTKCCRMPLRQASTCLVRVRMQQRILWARHTFHTKHMSMPELTALDT